MQQLVNVLEQSNNWKQIMRVSCKLNNLNPSYACDLTVIKLKMFHERFSKTYQLNPGKFKDSWIQNELRSFYWILIAVSGLKGLTIMKFGNQEWELIKKIFFLKDLEFLMYEAQKLIAPKGRKSKMWPKEQQKYLLQIIEQSGPNYKWNDIAKRLYVVSGHRYFRQGKNCRQRWYNHLDPHKKHGKWTAEQDLKILELVQSQGKRWSNIAKQFQSSRTEHMVKNRFNSMIVKEQRRSPDIKKQDKLIALLKKGLHEIILKERQDASEVSAKSQSQEAHFQSQRKQRFPIPQFQLQNKTRFVSGSTIQNQNLATQSLDQPLRDIIKEEPQKLTGNASSSYEIQPIYSPFYISQSPGTLTPTYISPPPAIPFFMKSDFAQNCSNFKVYLDNFGRTRLI